MINGIFKQIGNDVYSGHANLSQIYIVAIEFFCKCIDMKTIGYKNAIDPVMIIC